MSEESPQAIDPVCGMTVIPEKAAGFFDYQGTRYYLCSLSCLRRFEADPEQFLQPRAVVAPAPPGAQYVCPMDPEIHQDHPGFCPKCGMALEPLNITFEDAPNPELLDMSRRFRIAALLGAPAFVLAMSEMVFGMGLGGRIDPRITNWIGLASATPVVLWAGWPFFERGWASIVNRSPNMFTLIALGVGAAYLFSVAGTMAPGVFPAGFRMHGVVETYFDTAVVITVLVLLGQVLELRARGRTSSALRQLLLAFIYNAVGVPVAAGALYPFLGLLISPIWASAAMTLSSVSVIGNALRLRNANL